LWHNNIFLGNASVCGIICIGVFYLKHFGVVLCSQSLQVSHVFGRNRVIYLPLEGIALHFMLVKSFSCQVFM